MLRLGNLCTLDFLLTDTSENLHRLNLDDDRDDDDDADDADDDGDDDDGDDDRDDGDLCKLDFLLTDTSVGELASLEEKSSSPLLLPS